MPHRNTLLVRLCLVALLLCGGAWRPAAASMAFIDSQIAAHPDSHTGQFLKPVLERPAALRRKTG